MNKIKKLVSLFTIITILMSLCVFAEENAQKDETKYVEEISLLSDIGLIGDSNDYSSFCTRGEFARILTEILNRNKPYISDSKQIFSDISEDNKYFHCVAFMYDLSLMKGHTDGTFKPEGNISYNEAVSVIVNLLGYGVKASVYGGYPSGHLRVANDIKLLSGFSAKDTSQLTYSEIFKLIYNSLFISVAEQIAFGDSTGFSSENGCTLLNTYLDMDFTEGLLSDNSITALNGESRIKQNAILVGSVVVSDATKSAKEYLGYNVRVYYKVTDGGNIFVHIEELKDRNNVLIIDASKIKPNSTLIKVEYEINEDNTKTANIRTDADYIKNGVSVGNLTSSDLFISGGNIKLIDYNSDKKYDILFTNEFQFMVYKNTNMNGDILYGHFDEKVDISKCDEILVYDKTGKEIGMADLREYDVIAITKSDKKAVVEVCTSAYYGFLNEITDEYYVLDGKKYLLAEEYKNSGKPLPEVGQEGTFYFGKGEYLVYFEHSASRNPGVAIALTGKTAGLEETIPQIKIYTVNKEFKIFDFEEKFSINGKRIKREDIYNETALFETNGSFKRQVVMYELGEQGYIKSIEYDDGTKPDTDKLQSASQKRTYKYASSGTKAIYPAGNVENADNRGMFITADTYYFKLPEDINAERYYSVSKGSLPYRHDASFSDAQVFFSNVNDKKSAAASIVTVDSKVSRTGSWATRSTVVTDIIKGLDPDGEPCQILTGLQKGKEVKYYAMDGAQINGLDVGDVIQLTENDGMIVKYRKTYSSRLNKSCIEWYNLYKDDTDKLYDFYGISDVDSVDSLDYYVNKEILELASTYGTRSSSVTFNTDISGQYVTGKVTYKNGKYMSVLTGDGRELQFLLNESNVDYYNTFVYHFNNANEKVSYIKADNISVDDYVFAFTEAFSTIEVMVIE